jgi:hypothetical protein
VANTVAIANFSFLPGGLAMGGALRNPPQVRQGQSLNFMNLDAQALIYHTVTACREPCNRETGVSYPLANGAKQFDSGQLGLGINGLTSASNRISWSTPRNLSPGTYAFFCRIHPFMRGAFRVKR